MASVYHLPRFSSDHSPILLRLTPPKPKSKPKFKSENWWMLKPGFDEVCKKAAELGKGNWAATRKSYKKEARRWVQAEKTPDQLLKEVEKRMAEMNSQRPDMVDKELEKEIQVEHDRLLFMRESYWCQRAKVQWALFGDANSSYFHAVATTRKRRNVVKSLQMEDGSWETGEKEIRSAFLKHFRSIYTSDQPKSVHSPDWKEVLSQIPKLSAHAASHIVSLPTDPEIFKIVMSLGPDKSPGPDGINARLVQENWQHFGPAILAEIHSFFSTGQMPSHIARSNIVLIPKSLEAAKVTEYRPISVCNISYKIISKLIAARIRPLISLCVSKMQSAFIPGREISENVILLREVLHCFRMKNYKKAQFCLKVDLSKAFDRMQWSYLEEILPLYGFPAQVISWIMACVSSAEYTIILNGRGDGFFKPTCGLRQGCALSPYLFIIGMDLLSRKLQHQTDLGRLKGIRVSANAIPLTNCLYADDLLLFGEATTQEAVLFTQILESFMEVSGQRIGPSKSSIWFSVTTQDQIKKEIGLIFQVPRHQDSKKYLGAPIETNSASYEFLIEKFSGKLQAWKARLLSQAGRGVLIKAVLNSLPIYYMATSKIPSNVLQKLNSIIFGFFWGKSDQKRYMAYVGRAKLCQPQSCGGLGLKDLKGVNDAMLLKQLWKLAADPTSQ